jgi:hypothetical protein
MLTGAALALVPGVAEAKVLSPWGSALAHPATLDTANGSYGRTISPSTHAITPQRHDATDLAVWNTAIAHRRVTAPQGGQVLAIRVRGCARRDPTAPSQRSPTGPGSSMPANTVNFQTLLSGGHGSFVPQVTAPNFTLPFCSSSTKPGTGPVSTSTVTTFHPLHLCLARGATVAFSDIGGFVPAAYGRGPAYPQGVPFLVLAPNHGSSMRSFADAQAGGAYAPGRRPAGADSGWGAESNEEVLLQVVEGVGADAYGVCPGGHAEESSSSNKVICVISGPTDGHRACGHATDLAWRGGSDAL